MSDHLLSIADQWKTLLVIVAALSGLKMLLLPSYHSTDFEVHRNWMAITHSLPLKEWYFDTTSQWTLDYPPFFAYFEWILSQVAQLVEPEMLKVSSVGYASWQTVHFQRLSVVVTDLVFVFFTWKLLMPLKQRQELAPFLRSLRRTLLVTSNVGLLMVDHMHFQYNGVLMGLLIGSVYFAQQGNLFALTACFSVLVLMKHLFAPLAIVFAVYILSECFFASRRSLWAGAMQLLGCVYVAAVNICAAFGPFLLLEQGIQKQLPQIISRLFPFGRGLVHAYWAGNVWALYCLVDKLTAALLSRLGLPHSVLTGPLSAAVATVSGEAGGTGISSEVASAAATVMHSSTSGLVGDFALAVLPRVSATHCLVLMLMLGLFPAAVFVFISKYRESSKKSAVGTGALSVNVLVRALCFASLSSFMFGFHVHEKAIIIPWLLFSLVAATPMDRCLLWMLSTAGAVSLFPLLPGAFGLVTKFALLLASMSVHWLCLDVASLPLPLLRSAQCAALCLVLTALYSECIHGYLFSDAQGIVSLPFLPLMLVSCVCAMFNLICWLALAWQTMSQIFSPHRSST